MATNDLARPSVKFTYGIESKLLPVIFTIFLTPTINAQDFSEDSDHPQFITIIDGEVDKSGITDDDATWTFFLTVSAISKGETQFNLHGWLQEIFGMSESESGNFIIAVNSATEEYENNIATISSVAQTCSDVTYLMSSKEVLIAELNAAKQRELSERSEFVFSILNALNDKSKENIRSHADNQVKAGMNVSEVDFEKYISQDSVSVESVVSRLCGHLR